MNYLLFTDYLEMIVIPAGSTSVLIKEEGKPENYIGKVSVSLFEFSLYFSEVFPSLINTSHSMYVSVVSLAFEKGCKVSMIFISTVSFAVELELGNVKCHISCIFTRKLQMSLKVSIVVKIQPFWSKCERFKISKVMEGKSELKSFTTARKRAKS